MGQKRLGFGRCVRPARLVAKAPEDREESRGIRPADRSNYRNQENATCRGYLRRLALLRMAGMPPQGNRTTIPRRYVHGEMTPMKSCRLLANLLNDDSGQDLIEYALVAAVLALAAVGAMSSLTNKIDNEFNKVGNSL